MAELGVRMLGTCARCGSAVCKSVDEGFYFFGKPGPSQLLWHEECQPRTLPAHYSPPWDPADLA